MSTASTSVCCRKKSRHYPEHKLVKPQSPIVRGFDDIFDAPHSRYAEVSADEIQAIPELEIIANSEIAGPYIIARKDGRQLFVTGHWGVRTDVFKDKIRAGYRSRADPEIPETLFPDDDPTRPPRITWKSHGNLLFQNWLNYYVYQLTPYDAAQIGRSLDETHMELA
ncbi:MAG: homoserine O-succinyltransferase [Gammaproteobacteria bacterium]|nr:homoserine O-succinyltransferase [Gammaproteobacteria bacterium]